MTKSFLIILLFFCMSCNAQSDEDKELQRDELTLRENIDTSKNQPEVTVKVDKKYDDEGNLIGYDSTYSYVYRSFDGDTINLNMDSVFSEFKPFMNRNFDIYGGDPFSGFFEKDSLFYKNFFDEDYFQNRFFESRKEFEEMFRRMDSLKNDFYHDKMLKPKEEKSDNEI